MLDNFVFVLVLASTFILILAWAFKRLPGEGWQIMASIPVSRNESGSWKGINLTYYGFFSANAYALSVGLLFLLLGSLAVPATITWLLVGLTLFICIPASRFLAGIVENKEYTFTVGGASFVGVIHIPFLLLLINGFLEFSEYRPIPVIPALAAISIAFTLGEGLGRLACISFGCCYGKALASCSPLIGKLFQRYNFTFAGKTKKIAYAAGLDGQTVVPIQAITATLYVATALLSTLLFLHSLFTAAYLLCIVISQGWRIVSEVFREDFRGGGNFSAYQKMALFSMLFGSLLPLIFPPGYSGIPLLRKGFHAVWKPEFLVILECLWVLIFIYTGRSQVTESTLTFHVRKDRV